MAGALACSPADQPEDREPASASDSVSATAAAPVQPQTVPFRVPELSEEPDSAVRVAILRGRALLEHTRDSLPEHVGNRLQCVSCHPAAGTRPNMMPFVGVYSRFPQYRSRMARVALIEDRVNDCFERSMNGKALPMDGQDMRDMVAYFAFLSRGVPVGAYVEGMSVPKLPRLTGDTARGRELFTRLCVVCHGSDGEGTVGAPPLWGPGSYNIGAGMARVGTAAAFIRVAMPFNDPGSLSDQDAYDLAALINSQPRPDYPGKVQDWPYGGAPIDTPYPTGTARVTSMR
jgi:thiosulfate dehydrogenase